MAGAVFQRFVHVVLILSDNVKIRQVHIIEYSLKLLFCGME